MTKISVIVARKFPSLKKTLRMAKMERTPEDFVKRTLRLASYGSLAFGALAFFLTAKSMKPLDVVILIFLVTLVSFFLMFFFFLNSPKATIRKRERDINKDVLFGGRFILMKIESGSPIINSLVDASRGYGIAAKYFKEIVDQINTGVPIEKALEEARTYTSSEKFKKVLWQLLVTLKTGTDVTGPLKATLSAIAKDQILEIKKYGKKLNSMMLFYMVVACVVPSLGLTIFLIIGSFLQISVSQAALYGILFGLAIIQGFFLMMIKAIRPMVEI
jgi:pilus assembly protein TadC